MFRRVVILVGSFALWVVVFATVTGARGVGQNPPPVAPAERGSGWLLPVTAAEEKNPLTINPAVIANGKKIFLDKCQRCHGPEGKGDGPEGEAEHAQDMNLTVASRAARNSDGVVFYKIWNGRATPKMPEFSKDLSKEQAWAIVAYVQTLRAKTAGRLR